MILIYISIPHPYNFKNRVPNTSCDRSRMVNTDKFVARSGDMEIRLLLVNEESVRHPYIPNKFRSNRKSFNAISFFICESRIRPKLSKVEIQCEILQNTLLFKTSSHLTKTVSHNACHQLLLLRYGIIMYLNE